MVSFSRIIPGVPYDKTCPINKGEHPFLRQKSHVSYRHSIVKSVEYMKASIGSGEAKFTTSIDRELLDLICEGLEKSPYTPKTALEFYRLAMSQ
ncbi:hypothetical protein [Candidatus Mycalebacterium sp.]